MLTLNQSEMSRACGANVFEGSVVIRSKVVLSDVTAPPSFSLWHPDLIFGWCWICLLHPSHKSYLVYNTYPDIPVSSILVKMYKMHVVGLSLRGLPAPNRGDITVVIAIFYFVWYDHNVVWAVYSLSKGICWKCRFPLGYSGKCDLYAVNLHQSTVSKALKLLSARVLISFSFIQSGFGVPICPLFQIYFWILAVNVFDCILL